MVKKYFVLFLCFAFGFSYAQETKTPSLPFSLEGTFFYGNIVEHNTNIGHLITGHPTGFMLTYNKKTFGLKENERRYNYPDWGLSFMYQNMINDNLGENISVYAHYTWYFLKRHLHLAVGQGIAYNTNPYHPDTNYHNTAYGSHILSTTYGKFGFVKENLWNGLGVSAGLIFIHYSNGNLKAPNTSTNSLVAQVGVSYEFNSENAIEYIPLSEDEPSHRERLKYNIVLRGGVNSSDVVGLGQEPFFVASAFVDKRLNYKSTLVGGVDIFFSKFLEDLIEYRSIAYPEDGLTGDEDYKRVGVFVGHELRLSKMALGVHLGYYVYWPYEFENRVYNRLALKRYFNNDTLFGVISVKSHWAKAEAIEFGIGVRI